MNRRTFGAGGLLLVFGPRPLPVVAQESSVILALGNAGFLDPAAIRAASGARVVHEIGAWRLADFAVVVLADVAYTALPPRVQAGVAAYVNAGGALLITGGPESWGAGGYQPLAPILPFKLLGHQDWGAVPFREPVPVQPSHPIMAGVEFIPIGTVNWAELAQGANEILRLAGGPHNYPFSLIAEKWSGGGMVLGMTFDPNELKGQATLSLFIRNVINYLLAVSRVA